MNASGLDACWLFFVFLMFIYLFILKGGGGRGREIEGENPKQVSRVSEEPNEGLDFTNLGLMTSVETKSLTLDGLSHPGAPPN